MTDWLQKCAQKNNVLLKGTGKVCRETGMCSLSALLRFLLLVCILRESENDRIGNNGSSMVLLVAWLVLVDKVGLCCLDT